MCGIHHGAQIGGRRGVDIKEVLHVLVFLAGRKGFHTPAPPWDIFRQMKGKGIATPSGMASHIGGGPVQPRQGLGDIGVGDVQRGQQADHIIGSSDGE